MKTEQEILKDFQDSFITTRGTRHPDYSMLWIINGWLENALKSYRLSLVEEVEAKRDEWKDEDGGGGRTGWNAAIRAIVALLKR